MATPSDSANYLQAVQALYLELRGGGLMLSPLDMDRVRAWRDGGVPLELALQGVRAAHKAFVGSGNRVRPFALRSAERHVAELAEGFERRGGAFSRASAAVTPAERGGEPDAVGGPLPRCIARLEARLVGGAPAARAAYTAALACLAPRADGAGSLDSILAAADEAQAFAYLRALRRPEQRALAQRARLEAGARAGMPRRSYRAMLRAFLCDAARAHGDLLRPSDLI